MTLNITTASINSSALSVISCCVKSQYQYVTLHIYSTWKTERKKESHCQLLNYSCQERQIRKKTPCISWINCIQSERLLKDVSQQFLTNSLYSIIAFCWKKFTSHLTVIKFKNHFPLTKYNVTDDTVFPLIFYHRREFWQVAPRESESIPSSEWNGVRQNRTAAGWAPREGVYLAPCGGGKPMWQNRHPREKSTIVPTHSASDLHRNDVL